MKRLPYRPRLDALESRCVPSYLPGAETFLGAGFGPAVLPDGAAAWTQSNAQDNHDIVTQTGTVVGGPDEQAFPALAPRPDGTYVLAWSAPDGPGEATWGVWVENVDAAFSSLGTPVRVDGGVAGYLPTPLVVVQSSGTATVFYEGVWDGQSTPQWARDLDASLMPLGSPYGEARPAVPDAPVTAVVDTAGQVVVSTPDGPFIANSLPADPLYQATVAVGPDGSFAVGWTGANYGGAWTRTYAAQAPLAFAAVPERYWVGGDGRVWSSILQAPVTNNQVKQVLAGQAGNGGTLLFAVGLDDRVYRLHVGADGHAAGGWLLLGPERVLGLTSARLDDSSPVLVARGLNGYQYATTFDPAGDAHDPWHLLA